MKPIGTILCPIDFTPVSDLELELAGQLAERFEASLLLQHNLPFGAGLGVSWMYEKEHRGEDDAKEAAVRERLAIALQGLAPPVRAKARAAITYGALDHCVQNMAEQAGADLIVIGTHGRTRAEHTSEAEQLVTAAPCPVLTTHDDAPHEWLPELDGGDRRVRTLVPIDFSAHSTAALRYAIGVAERLPLDVTALYVAQREDRDRAWAEAKLAETLGDDAGKVGLDMRFGSPIDEILGEEDAIQAHLVVMGAHPRSLFERLRRHRATTARELLHRSRCPVWFVPSTARA